MANKRCVQTVNVYGRPFSKVNCDELVHWHKYTPPGECDDWPASCQHHLPLYDEFAEWVEDVRNGRMQAED